jgi:hypothetical protein
MFNWGFPILKRGFFSSIVATSKSKVGKIEIVLTLNVNSDNEGKITTSNLPRKSFPP